MEQAQRQAAEAMAETLRRYERWEGDLILGPEAWDGNDLPCLTQVQWDEFVDIRAQRNAALRGWQIACGQLVMAL